MNEYINSTKENIDKEHMCCAISDKKHEEGILSKKEWIKSKLDEGHLFIKLNAQGKELLEYAINDAKKQGKNGICTISSKTKTPFISDAKFFKKYGFKIVDSINDYELLSLDFNEEKPSFNENVKKMKIDFKDLTIYYSNECPFVANCIKKIKELAKESGKKIVFNRIDTLEKAKKVPCIFNNWAVFMNGRFVSNTLLNKNSASKLYE